MSDATQRPTLRQLEYAIAVADHSSFSRAAEACFVTQPALSSQIQQLERSVGARLFERGGRRVLLTESGRVLVERARRVMTDVDDLSGAVLALKTPLTAPVRLGAIPTIAPYLLPRALPDLGKDYPSLRLLLTEGRTERLVRLLEEGRLDVALMALEADLGELETYPLFQDPFVLAVPHDSELENETISVDDLEPLAQSMLVLEEGHCFGDQVVSVCDHAGVSALGDFRAGSLMTLVQMVAGGVGITLLPTLAVESVIPPTSAIRCIAFDEPRPFRTIGLAWRSSSPRVEEFKILAQYFETFGDDL